MSHSLSRRRLLTRSCALAGLHSVSRVAGMGAAAIACNGMALAAPERPAEPSPQPRTGAGAGQEGRTVQSPQSPQMPELAELPQVPASLSLDFNVYYGDSTSRGVQVAQAVYRLNHSQDEYRLETEARATGVLSVFYGGMLLQSSVGALDAQGFRPRRYTEKRGKRPERQLDFDARTRRIRLVGDPTVQLPFPEGTQDRLSVFFQLGLLARSNQSVVRPGQRFILPLAGTHRIDEPLFQVLGREAMRTAAGAFEALHIAVSKPGDADAPKFDIWLAPSLQMLPVRIRVVDGNDGKVVDQVLKSKPTGV